MTGETGTGTKGGQGRRAWSALLCLMGGLLQSALEQEGPHWYGSQRMEQSKGAKFLQRPQPLSSPTQPSPDPPTGPAVQHLDPGAGSPA